MQADRIGIFSINRAEWILSDAACHHQGFVPVALYATLGANAVEFVVNHAEITVVLCDGKNIDKVFIPLFSPFCFVGAYYCH